MMASLVAGFRQRAPTKAAAEIGTLPSAPRHIMIANGDMFAPPSLILSPPIHQVIRTRMTLIRADHLLRVRDLLVATERTTTRPDAER